MTTDNYDVTFVLPGVSSKYPSGGYDIIYRLANALNKNGIRTSIIFWFDSAKYFNDSYCEKNKNKIEILKHKLFYELSYLLFKGKKLNLFYHNFKSINRLRGIDYPYDLLKNVDTFLYKTPHEVKFNTKIVFATAWQTAYFVKEYLKSHKSSPYYLIQNNEDEPSFSGKQSNLAHATYKFNFKKFVINKKLLERFKKDNPLFFHVGIDTKFYKIIKPLSKRKNVVLFPFRSGESKGSKYAFETIEKLLQSDFKNKIKIIAYGNIKNEEIPSTISGYLLYYYLPSRWQLLNIYNESKIFVLPSLVEGTPLPPLEAMACGSAVIVTDNRGVNEYIKDKVNGLMCPIKDSECLFQKIIYLLNNEEMIKKLSKNGLLTAKKFSYEKMCNNFVKLISHELKIAIANLGLDERFTKNTQNKGIKKTNIFKVGYLGAFGPNKNIKFILQAAELIKDKNIEFNIYGNKEYWYENFDKYAPANVKFMGFAPEEKIVEIYDSFDVFVFPSLYEGFGLPTLEAQARGLPVIIYKYGKIPKEVRRFCFEAESPEHMAQIIEQLKDNGYNEKEKKKAMEYARSFTWEKAAKETLELYKKY